jgi:hypothetical protein
MMMTIRKLLFSVLMVLVWSLLIWGFGCIWNWKLLQFNEFYNFATWGSISRMAYFIWMTIVFLVGFDTDI